MASNRFTVGDLVWVRQSLSTNATARLQQVTEEAGVILKVGCEHIPSSNQRSNRRAAANDGIMVKLQVSNMRGIFPSSCLRPFVEGNVKSESESFVSTPSAGSTRRRTPRSCVTPSPVVSSAASLTKNSDDKGNQDTSDKKTNRKSQTKRKQKDSSVDDDEDAANLAKKSRTGRGPGSKPVPKKPGSAAAKKPAKPGKKPSVKQPAKASPDRKRQPKMIVASKSSSDSDSQSSEDRSDNGDDDTKAKPIFRVEYSPTGRATCRTCDMKIDQDEVRVCHTPLFRGKPGYVVYRHLLCATFDDTVHMKEDIGGWKRLKKADQEALSDRIEVAKAIMEKESRELHPDELVQASFQGEIRKSPPGLDATLLPFQVEGASWMYCQEVKAPVIRGGLLADEMGMGKTIQTITTILDNRPKLQHCKPGAKHPPKAPDLEDRKREENLWKESLESWHHEMEMSNVPKKLLPKGTKARPGGALRAGTLVCCPVIALHQWKEEIERFTEGKALTICVYHGPNRAKEFPRELLVKYDIVLTTYQVIEAEYRKMVSPNKIKCPNCGNKFKIDKLRVHLKYFCGEGAQRTEAQARQRRSADNTRRGGGGRPASGNKKKDFAKKSGTKQAGAGSKSKTKSKGAPARKSVIRMQSTKDYETDDDLSIPGDVVPMSVSSSRPSRSAAKVAAEKLSASAKEVDESGESDDSNSGDSSSGVGSGTSDSSSDEELSSDVEPMENISTRKKRVIRKPVSKPARIDSSDSSEDEDSDSDSEDDEAARRVREKQRLAIEQASKKTFKKGSGGKLAEKKKVAKKAAMSGKRKKPPTPSSDESSESDSDDDEDRDPLEGIDMEQLMDEAMAGSRFSPLHTLCWWRVVLDEAHFIKSRSSQTAASAFSLTAIHRWCLSGTPLQNRVGELYSLIRFLRIKPMAQYFCRKDGCDCASLHYRMRDGKCQGCNHSSIQHYSYFNKHVLNPIQRDGYQGDGRRAMLKLKNEVLDTSLLRRTKQSRAEDMNLPPRVVTIKTIRLHPRESDFYESLYNSTRSSFDDYVTDGTLLNNYAHIFDLLTKLRQSVDHPYLIVYSKKNMEKRILNGPVVANGRVDCELCDDPPTDRVISSCCGAGFCRSCVIDYMSLENSETDTTRCPSCRAPFSIDLQQASAEIEDDGTLTVPESKNEVGSPLENMPSLKEMTHVASGSILRRINLAEFTTSTKLEALVQELVQMRRERPGSKALVFSQFVNMLDLVRWRLHSDPCLQDLGLGVRIIHGGMNVQSRDESLRSFREDPSVRVLLMSLKAGGVALNLTVANEAYLLDPWWNPAAEMQAIDRTHRLGQFRPIRAVRFIAEGTVEERVLQLQEKKRLVFDGTVGRDAASLKMLTVDDMKALFT